MKILGRKRLRTCLSVLLVAVCILTSFSFFDIQSNAQDEAERSFYILDEDGNPVTIEIPQASPVRSLKSRVMSLLALDGGENVGRAADISVVRFKSTDPDSGGVVKYTEVDSGREGYFNCYSAGDAAYIRTEGDFVFCKLSGVVMKVPQANVKEIVAFENAGDKGVSYYSIVDGFLVHSFTYYDGNTLSMSSTRVGYKPSYLETGKRYYSYDGHYFYTDFAQMIRDYRNNTYNGAVNKDTPYYNYYQYLSFHTVAPFTADQYNGYIAKNKTDSVMLTTGNGFVTAQSEYTINALMMFGVAINESGWGTSKYAKNNNNLFGLNAVDSNPDNAKQFPSLTACIKEFAYHWIHKGYLNGGDSRYRGPHLGDKHSGINVKYASDPYWGEKAAARGYYVDTQKADYGRYTIGIATSGKINLYKEANLASTRIYTTDASNGSNIYDYPVTILEQVTGSDGRVFYKVASDMSLQNDRNARNVTANYNTNRDYVYVLATDVRVVFQGSGAQITPPTPSVGGKTHAEVLSHLGVTNSENRLTGLAVGSDIATVLAKISALDSGISVFARNASGTQISNGAIATGMTITISTDGNTITYTFVVRGDLNGDGNLSAGDYVRLRNYLDGKRTLTSAELSGADTNQDRNVSAVDYVKLRNHLDGKSTITQ